MDDRHLRTDPTGHARLTQYLLGELAEEDCLKLEQECFEDDRLFEQLEAVEAELTDDYVRGVLRGREREEFEKRMLRTSGGVAEIEFSRRITGYGSRQPARRSLLGSFKVRIGDYASPAWLLRASTAVMFGIELAVPFLIFLPRRLRHCAAAAFAALQVLILLTGNYCFFNWLTLALCLPLLDDALLHRFLPACWRTKPPVLRRDSWARWPVQVTLALAVIVACASLVQLFATFHVLLRHPDPAYAVFRWVQPLRSFNNYGLFAVMTTTRLEIVVEGSNDGESWSAYEFKYKPGDLQRRPGFVAPHQPRLDWQMWFAALGDYRQNPWFVNFCIRLLQGSPEVTALLERNPFPKAPPRFIRAELYEYHFTDAATRRRSGEWWRRELKGIYLPPFSLEVSSPPPAS